MGCLESREELKDQQTDPIQGQLNLSLKEQKKAEDTSPRSGRRSSNPQWVPKGNTPRITGVNPGGATGETDQIPNSTSDRDENAIAAATGEANNSTNAKVSVTKIPLASNPTSEENLKPGDEADTEGTGKKKQNKNKEKKQQESSNQKGGGKTGGKKGNQKKQNTKDL